MDSFDLIVIGCGPAGEKGAVLGAYAGKRVLVVERELAVGGTVANTGTLPSKALRETALYLSGLRQRGLHGVEVTLHRRVTLRDFLYHQRVVSHFERERIFSNLGAYGVEVRYGEGSFEDAHTLLVRSPHKDVRIRGERFLIATGSHPLRPAAYPFHAPNVFDSDTILQLPSIPESLVVVGAGAVGTEYACTFAALGIPVTLVDPRSPLLPFLDQEVAALLFERMGQMGVTLRAPELVEQVEVGPERVRLKLRSGSSCEASAVLVTAGRVANTAELGLERLGITLDRRGRIPVNEHFQTAVPNLYAAGDVVGFPALASTAMEQARSAVVHAFSLERPEGVPATLPYALYTIPEVSMAGQTEQGLKAAGIDYVAGRAWFANNPRGQIIGEQGGLMKLLFRRQDMKLLGAHVLGEQASELIHVGLGALLAQATGDYFIRTCFNFPSLSESYKYATYDAYVNREHQQRRPGASWDGAARPTP